MLLTGDFDIFWKELDGLMEDYYKAAQERRNGQSCHLPLAVSVQNLINRVIFIFFLSVFSEIQNYSENAIFCSFSPLPSPVTFGKH